ncbi:MAG TPA: hypothetical protein VF403_20400 [Kofleriaceae bacterium]
MATDPDLDSFLSDRRLAFAGVSTSVECPTRDLFRGQVARGHDDATRAIARASTRPIKG